MKSSMTDGSVSLRALRWSARVWSILAVGLVLLFASGEGMNLAHFTAHELVLFVFFPLGVCLGMAVAWRWALPLPISIAWPGTGSCSLRVTASRPARPHELRS